jgi:hypothetical protein
MIHELANVLSQVSVQDGLICVNGIYVCTKEQVDGIRDEARQYGEFLALGRMGVRLNEVRAQVDKLDQDLTIREMETITHIFDQLKAKLGILRKEADPEQ